MTSTTATTTPILVVDDSPGCLHLACSLLENLGATSLASGCFAQAVELALIHRPQLALIDLVMPEGHGAILSAQLHTLNPHIVTFSVSASDPQEFDCPPGLDGQFAGSLSKPLSAASLHHLIRTQQVTPRLPSEHEGIQGRLLSLPEHQRKMFLHMLLQDIQEVTRLMQSSRTREQQTHYLHRLAGIFSAASAQELEDVRTLEAWLKQGQALSSAQAKQLGDLISRVKQRIEHQLLNMHA